MERTLIVYSRLEDKKGPETISREGKGKEKGRTRVADPATELRGSRFQLVLREGRASQQLQ